MDVARKRKNLEETEKLSSAAKGGEVEDNHLKVQSCM